MKVFAFVAATLFAPSVLASPSVHVEHRGATTKYVVERAPDAGFGRPQNDAQVRMQVLAGKYSNLGGKTCGELFEGLFIFVTGNLPDDDGSASGIVFEGYAGCSSQERDGPALSFEYLFGFEPRTALGEPILAEYMASHDGQMVDENLMHFVRVFAVMADLGFNMSYVDKDGVSKTIADLRSNRLFVNGAQYRSWAGKIDGAVSSIAHFGDWLGGEVGKDTASYYQTEVFPAVNYLTGFAEATLITEERALLGFTFSGPFVLDCRESANGYCL